MLTKHRSSEMIPNKAETQTSPAGLIDAAGLV